LPEFEGLHQPFTPDGEALIANIARQGTPRRAHHIELFHDAPVLDAIAERFDLYPESGEGLIHALRKQIAAHRFLGFDYVKVEPVGMHWPMRWELADDTAKATAHRQGRSWMNEHTGPITNWEEFEQYPWPDPDVDGNYQMMEWAEQNVPEDMCVIGGNLGHFAEYLSWLMGYETLCFALFEQRDLVQAIADRLLNIYRRQLRRMLQFERMTMVFPSDDMGFRTGLLISPDDTRQFVLAGHKALATMAHDAGRLYLLHCCGYLYDIIDDLVHDVRIDAKHSYEDTIEDVRGVKHTYGREIAMLGGIDVDFLCRSDEQAIRGRVRDTLDKCLPGGGYCLGTGNTACNYIPLDNYLTMVDEGRLYSS